MTLWNKTLQFNSTDRFCFCLTHCSVRCKKILQYTFLFQEFLLIKIILLAHGMQYGNDNEAEIKTTLRWKWKCSKDTRTSANIQFNICRTALNLNISLKASQNWQCLFKKVSDSVTKSNNLTVITCLYEISLIVGKKFLPNALHYVCMYNKQTLTLPNKLDLNYIHMAS